MTQDSNAAEARGKRASKRPVWLGEDRRTWDHTRVHVQILDDPRLGIYEVGVYLGLARHAEAGTGTARPSKATLAGYLGCSARKAQDAIRVLEETGYLEVAENPGHASAYRLLPPPPLPEHVVLPPDREPEQETTDHPSTVCSPPEQETTRTRARGAPEQETENESQELEPSNERDRSALARNTDAAIEDLCHLLARRVAAHMKQPEPPVSARWRKDMRLLVERGPLKQKDPTPLEPETVRRAIDVVFDELAEPEGARGFCWASNIRSPGALRDHWHQLRDAARRHRANGMTARERRIVDRGLAPIFAEADALAGMSRDEYLDRTRPVQRPELGAPADA